MSRKIFGVAAAAMMLTLSAAAHAAPVAVKVSDIDIDTAQGAAVLKQRTDDAARSYCTSHSGRGLSERTACRDGVRAEIGERAAARQLALKAGKTTEMAAADKTRPAR
jgi:UrcA family protein